jgi:hypothetical protein
MDGLLRKEWGYGMFHIATQRQQVASVLACAVLV